LHKKCAKWHCKTHIFDEKLVKNPRILLKAELLPIALLFYKKSVLSKVN